MSTDRILLGRPDCRDRADLCGRACDRICTFLASFLNILVLIV